MNETPTPPEGYKLIIDQANGPVTLVEGDALFDFSFPQNGWTLMTIDKKLFPKARISVAVPKERPKEQTPPPTPPEGYHLFTEPHKWQRLPKASRMWIPSANVWSIPSDYVSAIPGPAAFYALPEGAVVEEEQAVELTLPQESILQEAERLVNGDRQQSYGDAYESFERIADFWHAYLKTKLKETAHISAKDVAAMMILMKVSRSVTSNKRDNWVDIAGYAELGSKLEE